MRKQAINKIFCLVALLLMAWSSFAAAASVSLLENPTVGVPDFKNKGLVSKEWDRESLAMAADYAQAELLGTGRFQVLDRSAFGLKSLTNEYYLANSGLQDDSAVQIGKMQGAQYLLLGSINAVTTRKSQTSVVGAGSDRYKVYATVSMRIIDVETGQVVLAAVGHACEKNTVVKAPLNIIRIGTAEVDEEQVNSALENAVSDAINGPRGLIARMEGRVKAGK